MPTQFTDAMTVLFGFEWAGTVGYDFLRETIMEIDLTNSTLEFAEPANYSLNRGNWLPLRFNHNVPCVECELESREKGWFHLDTGAGTVAVIHPSAVERLELLKNRETTPQPLGGVGGNIDAELGQLKCLKVGDRSVSNVTTFFITGKEGALADRYVVGTFGAGVVGGMLIFDYGRRRLALIAESAPYNPPTKTPPKNPGSNA